MCHIKMNMCAHIENVIHEQQLESLKREYRKKAAIHRKAQTITDSHV